MIFRLFSGTASRVGLALICILFLPSIANANRLLYEGPGTHTFVAPAAGTYNFIVAGAKGGDAFSYPGGPGASARGDIALAAGQSVTIVVGGQGYAGGTSSGGGGGSYAYLTSSETLLLAGGGGGGSSTASGSGTGGSLTSDPALVVTGGVVNGVNGSNGACCGTTSAIGYGGRSQLSPLASAASLTAYAGNGYVSVGIPPYTVGGSVSSLAGSGLSLLNNGGDALAISANGTFTFSTGLANGASYDVTVGNQPSAPNQTCSVTNGSGTISDVEVTNVTVQCATTTYTVGGTVSGLAGSGLTINGITITENGAFTLGSFSDGSAYNAQVTTQPYGPTQACTVTDGTGAVSGANVTSIDVSCVTSSFSVGATVSGLLGSGLTILNNGANSQAAASDGPVSFGSQSSGTAYAITVGSQPVSPAQTCTVSSGTGTVADADVNAAIQCTSDPVRTFSDALPGGGTGTVSFTTADATCTYSSTSFSVSPGTPPDGVQAFESAAGFTVDSCQAGASLNVTVEYGQPLPDDATFWKTGTPWVEVPGASIGATSVQYTIVDGGPLDADGTANGTIVDPVVVGYPAAPAGGAKGIPTVPFYGLVLGALALLFAARRRLPA